MSFSFSFWTFKRNLNFTICPKNLQPQNVLVFSVVHMTFESPLKLSAKTSYLRVERLIRCFNYYFNPPPMIWSSAFLLKIDSHCAILNYLTQALDDAV